MLLNTLMFNSILSRISARMYTRFLPIRKDAGFNKNYNLFLSYSSQFINPYPTAFPYGNGMVLHFYQQQEKSTTKTVQKVINKGLKACV